MFRQSEFISAQPETKKDTVFDRYRNLEFFFSSVLESMQGGIVVLNRNFEILYANSSYSTYVGYHTDQIKGKHCYEVSHRNKKPCYQLGEECVVQQTFVTGSSSRIIHTHLDKKNNPLKFEAIAYPIKDLSGNIVSAAQMITDITEKIKLDEELKDRMKELEAFYDMAVGREMKMIELKEEIKSLREELTTLKNGFRA